MNEPGDDLELRALFIEEMQRHVGALLKAVGDNIARARTLHAMRGAAAMMGLVDVAARLGELEGDTRSGDVDAGVNALVDLDALLRVGGFEVTGMRNHPFAERIATTSSNPPSGRMGLSSMPPGERQSAPGFQRQGERTSLDPEVLAYFFSEARVRIEKLGESLDQLSRPNSGEAFDEAFRHVHSLKGAASTVGLGSIARGAHALEAALLALKSRSRDLYTAEIDVLLTARTRLGVALGSPAMAPSEVEALVAGLRAAGLIREHDLKPLEQLPKDRTRDTPAADIIRVPVSAVAGLAEHVGEVGFVGDRMALHALAVRDFGRILAEASRSVGDALQRIGPPRPWGAPADALERLGSVARDLSHASSDLDREGERLGRDSELLGTLAGGAREWLQRMEASTARWLFERVAPAAETLARREGRELYVVRDGDEIEIARGLAERLVEPMVQLVRNAVAHGVEAPATRLARSKPARATIKLSASVINDRLRLSVEDDGAGIDVEAVSVRARTLGLLSEHEASDPKAVLPTMFMPGVSTRARADATAGRGVGLDLVHREVLQMGGAVSVVTERGVFTRFDIEIPMRPIAQRMLVVQVAGERLAVPLDRVIRVVGGAAESNGAPLVSLDRASGLVAKSEAGSSRDELIVLLRSATGEIGLRVDGVDRAREFVVRPLPPLIVGLRPWAAATVDGEGRVMLVLDVDELQAV